MAQPLIEPSPSGRVVRIHQPQQTPLVLAVDDDRSLLLLLQERLMTLGYDVITASTGDAAMKFAQEHAERLDALLLDRMMPGLSGLDVVKMMKAIPQLAGIPIIMQTAADRPEQIQEGIDAGVFYYLTKPLNPALLTSVLASAIEESRRQRLLRQEMQQVNKSFLLMESARFEFRTLAEAHSLAAFVANAFPDPERVISGLAELAINAVEHGNLGITYDEKTVLMERRSWLNEVERRLASPEHLHKNAELILKRQTDGIYVQITDQGKGFEWKRYLTIDPSRATDNHGRGIAQANQLCFDALRYNEKGNQVIVCVRHHHQEPLEW